MKVAVGGGISVGGGAVGSRTDTGFPDLTLNDDKYALVKIC